MATYSTVKYGSSGSSVKQLQTLLNNNGANISVDGIFGDKTLAALKSYQKSSGLTVDGIAGVNTWGALTGSSGSKDSSSGSTDSTAATTPDQTTPEAVKLSTTPRGTEYDPGKLTSNQADMQYYQGNAPEAYDSPYSARIDEILGQILDRQPFQYDLNGDMLYQQYKDQYIRNGQRAMQDTAANAATLTGGYGNTYAATAGNQAYGRYLQELGARVPELYSAAYGRYRDEGNDLINNASLLQSLDNTGYGRYRDDVGDYLGMLDYYTGQVATDQSQANWQAEMDFALRQYEDAQTKKSSGGGGSSSKKSSGSSSSGSSSSSSTGLFQQMKQMGQDALASQQPATTMSYSTALSSARLIASSDSKSAAQSAINSWYSTGQISKSDRDRLISAL